MISQNSSIEYRPAFSDAIKSIVFFGSQEKVFWIYACGRVALMKYTLSLWNRTVMNIPRKLVHFVISYLALTLEKKAVLSIYGTNPEPTIRSLVDVFPKAFFYWPSPTFVTAKIGLARPNLVGLALEIFPTSFAFCEDWHG